MKKQKWIIATAVALVMATGVACDDDSTAPAVAGTFVVSLTTPSTDDGAIMFTISGGAATNPTLLDGTLQLYSSAGTNELTVVIVGDVEAGDLLEFDVPDVAAFDDYSAAIEEVADRTNDLVTPLTGYSLSIAQ
ncbi:MAG TPA: hypothetical protein VLC48_06900 [Gemmatimonadota bacterium]|nr:hypothetical protein [Gemmatimonadota bacterium]